MRFVNNPYYDYIGVILGVSISIGFIMICLCSIYCRRKFENSRLRNDAQPTNGCVLSRNRNECCAEQSSTSMSQHVNAPNEIELAVLCPSSPIETNPHSDAKVIERRKFEFMWILTRNNIYVLYRAHSLMGFSKFARKNPYCRRGRLMEARRMFILWRILRYYHGS